MRKVLLRLDAAGLKGLSDGHKRKAKYQNEPLFRLTILERFLLDKRNLLIQIDEIHKSILSLMFKQIVFPNTSNLMRSTKFLFILVRRSAFDHLLGMHRAQVVYISSRVSWAAGVLLWFLFDTSKG